MTAQDLLARVRQYGEPWTARCYTDLEAGREYPFLARANGQEIEASEADVVNRIVLCVNACAGIPDEALARLDKGRIDWLDYLPPEVRKEVADKLCEAMTLVSHNMPTGAFFEHRWRQAANLVAEAKRLINEVGKCCIETLT